MSLGAMGAGQWTGRWRTRPHALLDVRGYGDVDESATSLPRGRRRGRSPNRSRRPSTQDEQSHRRRRAGAALVARAAATSSSTRRGCWRSRPTPSSRRCIAAISRYMGTAQQAGVIREYRDAETGRVLAFAHEVQKGRCMRGQWFYGTDAASKRYMWGHSVHELVRRSDRSTASMADGAERLRLVHRAQGAVRLRASRTGTSSPTTAAGFGTAMSSRSFCGRKILEKAHTTPRTHAPFVHPSSRFNRLIDVIYETYRRATAPARDCCQRVLALRRVTVGRELDAGPAPDAHSRHADPRAAEVRNSPALGNRHGVQPRLRRTIGRPSSPATTGSARPAARRCGRLRRRPTNKAPPAAGCCWKLGGCSRRRLLERAAAAGGWYCCCCGGGW